MEYLLVMSFSGSTMMCIYLLLKLLLKNKVSARMYYLMIREAVLFFLIPLPFLKDWYRAAVGAFLSWGRLKSVQIPVRWTNNVIHVGSKEYVNDYAVFQITVAVVWLIVVCALVIRLLVMYVQARRLILKCKGTETTDKQKLILTELKKQYGVRRPVILFQGQEGDHTMTFGILSPVIICDREIASWEAEIHVRHEMIHIKRMDALWKLLAWFAVILHWWNPVVWMMRRDLERVCEYSCDEIVMQGKTREEVKTYLRLLIEEACAASETERSSIGWQNSFADDVESMKERMDNLMKKKKWNRYAAGVLVAVLAFANSMTVFAYRDTLCQNVPESTPREEVMRSLHCDTFYFTPDGADTNDFELPQDTEILYEKQFADTEGNIYPYWDGETVITYRSCSHDFVSGTASEHTKKSDGSCEVRQYRAQRCCKCGYVIRGEEISVTTYKVCPH